MDPQDSSKGRLAVAPMRDMVPSEFLLGKNYPDPFDRKTTIKYCVAYRSRVRLVLRDSTRKTMKIILDQEKEAGTYRIELDASGLKQGIYFYTLKAGEYESTKTLIVKK